MLTHLKLCLATTIHNFKLVKITHVCLIWDNKFENLDVFKFRSKQMRFKLVIKRIKNDHDS